MRCSLRSKYSERRLIFFSVEMPRGFVQLGSVTGKIAGTNRLYLLIGTLAAVVGPIQLQLQSIIICLKLYDIVRDNFEAPLPKLLVFF